jgi:tetratricopeptide (TPR) repeat protein
VNNGMQSLKSAFTTKLADQKAKDLKEAERALTQAVTTGKQDKSPAAWYYLGRYYLMVQDGAGVDSSFAKALALEPKCKEDIGLYRRQAWVPLYNAGVQAWQAGNTDSAIVAFRNANQVYQGEPMGLIYIANLFVGREDPDSSLKRTDAAKYHTDSVMYATRLDSAAKYFRLAVPAASDPKYAKERRDAFLNVARVYHSAKRYPEADAAYREFLGAYPNDVQATASLAAVLVSESQRDSAMALYGGLVSHADSATADDLFSAAQSVLSVIPSSPDTAAMDSTCGTAQKKKTPTLTVRQISARCQPTAVDTMRKFHAFADPQYRLVVQMYEAGLTKNPYLRDALYNLTGISYLIGDTTKVLPLARRLYAVDPMNRLTLAKIAGGFQLLKQKDSVLYYLQLADSLPVEVTVGNFIANDKGAELTGLFTNFRSKASAPLTITFEFLDKTGAVVASKPQQVPTLDAGSNQSFKVTADQPTVAAWRYKRS